MGGITITTPVGAVICETDKPPEGSRSALRWLDRELRNVKVLTWIPSSRASSDGIDGHATQKLVGWREISPRNLASWARLILPKGKDIVQEVND